MKWPHFAARNSGHGDIFVNAQIDKTDGGEATLRMEAHDDIFVNQDIISTIKNEGKLILNQLYRTYRMDFVRFGRRYIQDEAAILDMYQAAFIVFFENVRSGKLKDIQSTLIFWAVLLPPCL